jgi:hypothetical protein
MPGIAKSVVTLRISGDALVPDEVTAQMGVAPTTSHRKGDVRRLSSGRDVVRRTGIWRLEVGDREPENLNAQVAELLALLPQDLGIWRTLSQAFEIDLFCGLFMEESNEGLSLSSETLAALGLRGIEVGLDIYAPTREIKPSETCPCGSGATYGECCGS